jgi:hypothetical protein
MQVDTSHALRLALLRQYTSKGVGDHEVRRHNRLQHTER